MLIDRLLQPAQKIIFLIELDHYYKTENLFALAQWMQGEKIVLDDDEPVYSPTKLHGVKEHVLTISGGKNFIQVLESDKGLMISLKMHEWKRIDKELTLQDEEMEEFVEKSLFLEYIFQKMVEEECQAKAYVAFEYDKKIER